MRAPTFDYRAKAGGFSYLHISAVKMSHQGYHGHGYILTSHFTPPLLMGNAQSKGGTYLCSAPISTRGEAALRTKGLAMMIESGPPALRVVCFDSINRRFVESAVAKARREP